MQPVSARPLNLFDSPAGQKFKIGAHPVDEKHARADPLRTAEGIKSMTSPGVGTMPSYAVTALTNSTTPAFEASRVIMQTGSVPPARDATPQPRQNTSRGQNQSQYSTESDITGEMVGLVVDRRLYTANLKALKAQQEMLGLLVDTLA